MTALYQNARRLRRSSDRYPPTMRELDLRLPLYGEDLERGDLRD